MEPFAFEVDQDRVAARLKWAEEYVDLLVGSERTGATAAAHEMLRGRCL